MRILSPRALWLVFAVTACGSQAPDAGPSGLGHDQAPLCASDVVLHDVPTTDGQLAMGNLDAQITGRADHVERRPHDLSARAGLVDLLLARTQFRGTFDDFDTALAHAEAALSHHPEAAEAHALHARVLAALHRFDDALAALAEAEARGLDVGDARDTIAIARGEDLSGVLARRQAAAEAHPNFTTLAGLAAAQAALGRFDEADASFRAALDAYGDVSPLPVAWVAFQRGVMWSEHAGETSVGCALYTAGTQRLPGYVVANVHLAEIERGASAEGAAARLETLLAATGDPEPAGLYGEVLLSQGEVERAEAFIAQAAARYDALLAKHRLAFADHGAEFFAGPGGDPDRALALALDNLDNRRNDRAYQVAIESALAAGEAGLACALAAEAGSDNASVVLDELVASLACAD